jgi:uncharacterized membrane protein YbhN (UPF0104 family)
MTTGLAAAVSPIGDEARWRRLAKVAGWLAAVATIVALLQLGGVDIGGWLSGLWRSVNAVPLRYVVVAVVLQTVQTTLTATAWLFVLRAAYRESHVRFAPVLTAYAVGTALNGVLPASLGTIIMLYLFVAVIPNATYAGVLAGTVAQKLFFTVAGVLVYLYLFLRVPGSATIELGSAARHPVVAAFLVVAAVVLLVLAVRAFRPRLRRQWQHAKQGGAILTSPRQYAVRVLLPSAGGYAAKLAVTATFLAAFTIPVTFDSVLHVIGGNSFASATAATPGGAGLNEAVSVVSLKDYTDAQTATAFAVAQHLVATGWNLVVALVLVPAVFGWRNGRAMLRSASAEAKERRAASRAERRRGHQAGGTISTGR